MGMSSSFLQRLNEINDVVTVLNLLNWDASTQMSLQGANSRGLQISTLSKVAMEKITDPELAQLADQVLKQSDASELAHQSALAYQNNIDLLRKQPESLISALASVTTLANVAWQHAKDTADFEHFAPHLEKIVALKQQQATALGYKNHPYEAMMQFYEPNLTVPQLQALFSVLKQRLIPLMQSVHQAPNCPNNSVLMREIPVAVQQSVCRYFAELIGFDFSRGRMDVSAHPFEISISPQDVRFTTRFKPTFLPTSLFGTLHEVGHAMYEQHIHPQYQRSIFATDLLGLYGVGGTSFGVHESQSRLWENRIGRSYAFWRQHFSQLQKMVAPVFDDVSLDDFYKAINASHPSCIRVEADELTYDLHIMLRVEIEMGLLDGSIQVKDLPTHWNALMTQYLGVTPQNDREGVLQDVHWSKGLFGSFPTYTLGNMMAAQFYQAACRANPAIEGELQAANYQGLQNWLHASVHQHARRYLPDELLRRATHESLNPDHYLSYLEDKFMKLIG